MTVRWHHGDDRRRLAAPLAAGAIVLGSAGLSAGSNAASPPDTPASGPFELRADTVATLRTAVADLAAPAEALATGRSDLVCVDGTGHYFANPEKSSDGVLDPVDPEALVYADVDGALRLVAVAWMSTAPGQVQGVPMHLDHDLELWVLHAWVGRANPSGLLADRNPLVGACAAGSPSAQSGGTSEQPAPPSTVPATTEPTTSSTEPTTATTEPATSEPESSAPPTTPPDDTSDFAVSATDLYFGVVPVGRTTGKAVRVTNTGPFRSARVEIVHEQLGGGFSYETNCDGVFLESGESCNVGYTFAPTIEGEYQVTTTFAIEDFYNSQFFAITLSGAATAPSSTIDITDPPQAPAAPADPAATTSD